MVLGVTHPGRKRVTTERVMGVLAEVKRLAREYYELTGKPLGITGEVAEYEAARLLGIELTPARQEGYDAIELRDGIRWTLQIKGRVILPTSKPGQRMGGINILKNWDAVLLVLLDEDFNATEILVVAQFDSPVGCSHASPPAMLCP